MNYAPTALLSAALLLGGCQTVFDLVGVEQPLSAEASRSYDGSYQGDISQTVQRGPDCPREHGEKVLMVGDGVLWYAYSPTILFTAPVRYDGTIAATSGDTVLSGKVTGNHLDMTIKSDNCQTELSLSYIYNHS